MRTHVTNAGEHGIYPDVAPRLAPPNAWTKGHNFSTYAGAIQSVPGYKTTIKTPTYPPYWLLAEAEEDTTSWYYAGFDTSGVLHIQKVTDTETEVDVSRTEAYEGTNTDRIFGNSSGGLPVWTNGVDEPQVWDTATSKFVDMSTITGWDEGDTCRILLWYRSYLVAMDITESGSRNKSKIRWSHVADIGALPDTWDETDATKLAGAFQITSSERIVTAEPLGEDLMIYTTGSTWRMTLLEGSLLVFDIAPLFENLGAASLHCAKATGDGRHIVYTGTDVRMHDGRGHKSLLTGRIARRMLQMASVEAKNRSFVTLDLVRNEALICYPQQSGPQSFPLWPDQALMINWETGNFGTRDIPVSAHAAQGDLEDYEKDETWDSVHRPWDGEIRIWDDVLRQGRSTLVFCCPSETKFYGYGLSYAFGGEDFQCYLERTDLLVDGADEDQVKTFTAMYPKINVGAGESVDIFFGVKFEEEGSIKWSGPYRYNPDTDRKIDILDTGVWPSMRISYIGKSRIKVTGYTLEWEAAGWR